MTMSILFFKLLIFTGLNSVNATIQNQPIDNNSNYTSRSLNFVLVQVQVTSENKAISFENPDLYFALNGSGLVPASKFLGPNKKNTLQVFEVETGISSFEVSYQGRHKSKTINFGPIMLSEDLPHYVKVKRLTPFTQVLQVNLNL